MYVTIFLSHLLTPDVLKLHHTTLFSAEKFSQGATLTQQQQKKTKNLYKIYIF